MKLGTERCVTKLLNYFVENVNRHPLITLIDALGSVREANCLSILSNNVAKSVQGGIALKENLINLICIKCAYRALHTGDNVSRHIRFSNDSIVEVQFAICRAQLYSISLSI